MPSMQAQVVEVIQIGTETAAIMDIPQKFMPEPGQYLPCQHPASEPILPAYLFRVASRQSKITLGPLPAAWQPGDWIMFDSPQGKGFRLPQSARRVGLLGLGVPPWRLLPLVESATDLGASISLFCEPPLPTESIHEVPSAVEVSPVSALQDNLDWPDYLAVDVNLEDLAQLSTLFGKTDLPFEGQVLIRTNMPCRGIGECGVCAVKTRKGWRLVCTDGPVFPLTEVLNVAG